MLLASVSVVYILVFHVKPKLPKIRSGILQLGDKKKETKETKRWVTALRTNNFSSSECSSESFWKRY